ncbi:FAD-binding oxidoreductase [Flexivirga caeni]|uniref:FAD-binding oxidoreductase n=1 Tax=Flexivirga caeni TaxID=2294115 RepID=UPI0011CE3F6A|nr:FAD-binding oxidoreductase [Flexivirga caeni]
MNTLTRRSALTSTAGLAATAIAGMSGCSPASALSSSAGRKPTTQDWIAFARTVTGPVFLPGTSGYRNSKLVFDTRFDGNAPVAVMGVKRVSDVAQAMRFATKFSLQISPRGGGHSYVGASATNGTFVLDMRALDSVSYRASDRTVAVGAGATLYDVKAQLAAHGRAIPTGTCPTVGVAGLTLGGGLGVESRAQGLTADRLTAAQLVLPDGRSVLADAHHYSDIFWALRGGGGGNIGMVTSLRFATHAATGKGIFTLTFPGTAAVPVMTGWARWIATAARSRWAGVHVDAIGGGRLHVSILGVTEAGDERAAAASVLRAVGVTPVATSYLRMSYLDSVIYLGGGTTSSRQGFTAGSDVLAKLDTNTATAIRAAVIARSAAGGPGSALLDPLTGAVTGPATSATAFPWRGHVASVQWYAGGTGYTSALHWLADAHRRVAHFSSGGYVNYLETGMPAKRYYATNLPRLAQIRAHYDPARRLHSGIVV